MTAIDREGLRHYADELADGYTITGDPHPAGQAIHALLGLVEQVEAERDEWLQTALDERGATRDLLEQIKARDARIKAVRDVLADADQHQNAFIQTGHLRRALDT